MRAPQLIDAKLADCRLHQSLDRAFDITGGPERMILGVDVARQPVIEQDGDRLGRGRGCPAILFCLLRIVAFVDLLAEFQGFIDCGQNGPRAASPLPVANCVPALTASDPVIENEGPRSACGDPDPEARRRDLALQLIARKIVTSLPASGTGSALTVDSLSFSPSSSRSVWFMPCPVSALCPHRQLAQASANGAPIITERQQIIA